MAAPAPRSTNVQWHAAGLDRDERWRRIGGGGATLWFTGLSGSGKSTVARAVELALIEAGRPAYLLDGDNLRHGLNGDLGFGPEDRAENVRRTAHVARLLADAGLIALASLISPYAADRELARRLHDEAGLAFVEVFVDTPLEICAERDPKGLYARARRGEIPEFTGVSAPYEAPERPEVRLDGAELAVADAVAAVLAAVPRGA